MGLFRGLNLLQSVEARTTLGEELESILSSSLGRKAEFGAMLSTRHMARRMAGNTVTMTAINASDTAIDIVFQQTSRYNYSAIEEVALNPDAMRSSSKVIQTLNTVVDNEYAWEFYSNSPFYEDNIINTISTLIGRDAASYDNIGELVSDPSAMYDISINARAMQAIVMSKPAMQSVTSNAAAMRDITNNINAMTITANSDLSMRLIAKSQIALDEVTDQARSIVVGVPSAIFILGANENAWDYILSTSTLLATNIYSLLIAFGGLDSSIYEDVNSIFADNAASAAIANSKPAMMAILYEPAALAQMVSSDNLSNILGSVIAIREITENIPIMDSLIRDRVAFPILLDSSVARAAIFASPTLVETMMTAGSDSLSTVKKLARTATVVNDAKIGTFKTIGIDGNIIILTGVMGSIVATTLENTFKGDNQEPFVIGLPGTSLSSGPLNINLPFTNAMWDIASIAATAAGNVTITYVDFN